MENEYFLSWLNTDECIKALATIKMYAERTGTGEEELTNEYLQYLAVIFCANEIVRKGKGDEVTDINVARSMIFDEEDNE